MPSSPDLRPSGLRTSDWAAILDELDAQLARADAFAPDTADAGHPVALPVDPGPIPDALVDRARAVLAAQREAMARLEGLRRDLARHIGATRAADARPDVAVYLDRSA